MTSYDEGNLTCAQFRYLSHGLSTLLARIEQPLRIDRRLDAGVERAGVPAFEDAEPVLPAHGSAELDRHLEDVLRRALGGLCLVRRDQEGRMDVAVARVAPRAGLEIVHPADYGEALQCVGEPLH